MNNTGIVRKIDELGRIVLPKELRKTLNISSGDDFQILLDNEKIILQRYSRLKKYNEKLIELINCFSSETKSDIYIIINNKIINSNKELNPLITKIIQGRKLYINENLSDINLFLGETISGKLVILPIVSNSDLLGSIVIISNQNIDTMITNAKIINNIIKNIVINDY